MARAEHPDGKIRRHAPRPGGGQLNRRHRGAGGQVEHFLAWADAERLAGGAPPVPVLTDREHGVGDVVAPRDAVEHRRHFTGVFVQGCAVHAIDTISQPGNGTPTDALNNGVTEKVWFITGTSRGFGREWAIAALDRGDKVAATARDTATLDDLVAKYGEAILPIELDGTSRTADCGAVTKALEHFGRLAVVVNNAGYGQFGFVEELSEADARDQIETNVFGALWVTQAALPYLRKQGFGHILQVSSIGGITAFPMIGM